MQPQNDKNFLIEVTPEQLHALQINYKYSDEEPYEVLHYSPYWKRSAPTSESKHER